jgi:hypothetical protein
MPIADIPAHPSNLLANRHAEGTRIGIQKGPYFGEGLGWSGGVEECLFPGRSGAVLDAPAVIPDLDNLAVMCKMVEQR